MQVGGDEITDRSPKVNQWDLRALGRLVEGSGAQDSVFPNPISGREEH